MFASQSHPVSNIRGLQRLHWFRLAVCASAYVDVATWQTHSGLSLAVVSNLCMGHLLHLRHPLCVWVCVSVCVCGYCSGFGLFDCHWNQNVTTERLKSHIHFVVQWKPLIMITLLPALFYNNNRLITLSGGYKYLHYLTQFIVTTFYMYKKQVEFSLSSLL